MNAWTAVPSNRRKITEADAELIDERVACFGHLRPLGRKFIPALHAWVAVMRKELFLPSPGRRRPGPPLRDGRGHGATACSRLGPGAAQDRFLAHLSIARCLTASRSTVLSSRIPRGAAPGEEAIANHRRSTKMAALRTRPLPRPL